MYIYTTACIIYTTACMYVYIPRHVYIIPQHYIYIYILEHVRLHDNNYIITSKFLILIWVDGGDRDRGGVDGVPLMSNFTKLCLFVCLV